jgi:hypothetical protein
VLCREANRGNDGVRFAMQYGLVRHILDTLEYTEEYDTIRVALQEVLDGDVTHARVKEGLLGLCKVEEGNVQVCINSTSCT